MKGGAFAAIIATAPASIATDTITRALPALRARLSTTPVYPLIDLAVLVVGAGSPVFEPVAIPETLCNFGVTLVGYERRTVFDICCREIRSYNA